MESLNSKADRERKSNRFVMCFKSGDRYYDEGDIVINGNDTFTCNNDEKNVVNDDCVDNGGRKKIKKKKSKFHRVLKAVLFDSSLAKKIKTKKTREGSFRSSSSLSTKSTSTTSSLTDEYNENHNTNENEFSANTATTTTIAEPSNGCSSSKVAMDQSSKGSNESKNSSATRHRKMNWNYGVCIFLVSFMVLLLWGKIYAIFCTSTCLILVSRRSIVRRERQIGVGASEFDSVGYKKKVIMEGMLGRKHSKFV